MALDGVRSEADAPHWLRDSQNKADLKGLLGPAADCFGGGLVIRWANLCVLAVSRLAV